ncbi:hypothetical protein SDC9_111179 [bioreactor metagenome]|uniref:Uncharacterized protein n=1 Tax=bioreactor metagenome TaxID=1076179 RepID=A0A645BLZ5_9ZZZZ
MLTHGLGCSTQLVGVGVHHHAPVVIDQNGPSTDGLRCAAHHGLRNIRTSRRRDEPTLGGIGATQIGMLGVRTGLRDRLDDS